MERTISLQLADILEQMPAGYVKSQETFDPARSIPLSASEIEKGMAESKPSVSLASIYKEAPEIFARRLAPTDVGLRPIAIRKSARAIQEPAGAARSSARRYAFPNLIHPS